MSAKGPNQASPEPHENPRHPNLINQIETKYFYRLEDEDPVTCQMIEKEVDLCRAQARGKFSAFLVTTQFGQLLAKHLVADPLYQEKEMRADNIDHYAHLLEGSGILPTAELADQYSRTCFEVLPNAAHLVVFQMQLQGLLENALRSFFHSGNFADLNQGYQRMKKELSERFNFSEEFISEQDGLQIFFREFVWKIKFQIAQLAFRHENTRVLEIVAALNTLSNNERMDLWTYLPLEINYLSTELSAKPQQRKILTDFSIRKMTSQGLKSFEEFSAFLQKIGVKKLEGEELTTLLDSQFLERSLNFAWKRDKKNYFECIEFLVEIGILPESYLHSDKMLHRSIEYYLIAFYNGEYNNLQKNILPYLLKLGIFPEKPSDPRNSDQLLDQYDSLCARLKLEKDIIIQQNYSRNKKPDKYLQGIDKE